MGDSTTEQPVGHVRERGGSSPLHRAPKAALQVARKILADIRMRSLHAGDVLPPEQSMLTQLDTGRGTLREALRLLEYHGVLYLKPGPGGGPVLTEIEPQALANTFQLVMHVESSPARDAIDFKAALLPGVCAAIAAQGSSSDLRPLATLLETMRGNSHDADAYLVAEQDFHDRLGRSCPNAILGHSLRAANVVVAQIETMPDLATREMISAVHDHDVVLGAMVRQDVDASRATAVELATSYVERLRRACLPGLDREVEWDPRSPR